MGVYGLGLGLHSRSHPGGEDLRLQFKRVAFILELRVRLMGLMAWVWVYTLIVAAESFERLETSAEDLS